MRPKAPHERGAGAPGDVRGIVLSVGSLRGYRATANSEEKPVESTDHTMAVGNPQIPVPHPLSLIGADHKPTRLVRLHRGAAHATGAPKTSHRLTPPPPPPRPLARTTWR